MKKSIALSVLAAIWALAALTCCNRHDGAADTLERAESLLPIRHDSAEVYLDSIPHPDRLAEDSRALYGLLRTIVQNRQDKGIKSDSLIRGSYEYYRDASRAGQTSDEALLRRYAQSCYYMALFYKACDSIKQCEDLLHQAIKGSERCEDWHTCYLAYNILGYTTKWGNDEYAIQQTLKALDTYYKINDDVTNEVLIMAKLAGRYLTAGYPDSALKYNQKGYELAEKNHLQKIQNQMCTKLASTYRYIGEYEKALYYAKRGITTADGEVLAASLKNLSACYYACDSLEQSKKILKSIQCDSDYIAEYTILRDLSEIAIKQRDFDSLFIYVDSAYECLEDRYFHLQGVKDEYYQENLAQELEKERMLHEAKLNKWVAVSIISVLALIALIIYNVLRKRIAAERQRRLDALRSQRLAQERQERVIAEQEREITHQREIIAQKAMTLSVIQKHLLDKIDYFSQELSGNETVRMSPDAWQELETLLDDTGGGFVRNLRQQHQDFKEEDIQLCMLVRLKLDNAIIGRIYGIGVEAVKKRKSRLKKKCFQIADPSIRLEDVIDRL